MTELPTGTVTFVFTDVEGSTRLLRQLREQFGELLAEHRRLIREAFTAHDGHEIDTQGDSFFFAFPRAKDAVAGAVAAQQTLEAHPWPTDARFRVRMGMHTGEPSIADDHYVGLGVHRAARVMAAGHGGQILLSQATAAVIQDEELPDVELVDLGSHQLKDIENPERIFQLVAPGLAADFPPLSADRAAEVGELLAGRGAELEEAARKAVGARPVLRRRALLVPMLAGVVAAAVAIPVLALARDGGEIRALEAIGANAVGAVDVDGGRLAAEVPLPDRPSLVATAGRTVWVASDRRPTVSALDRVSRRPQHVTPTGMRAGALAADLEGAWVVDRYGRRLVRIDREYGEAGRPTALPVPPEGLAARDAPAQPGIAIGGGAVWITTGSSRLLKVDPKTQRVLQAIDVGLSLDAVAFGNGLVWVASGPSATVAAVHPRTGQIEARIPIVVDPDATSPFPVAVAVGHGAVWTLNANTATVTKLDPRTRGVVATVPLGVGRAPARLAVGRGGVWVSNGGDGTLTRLDPMTLEAESIRVGNSPAGLALGDQEVWVAVQPSLAAAGAATQPATPATQRLSLPQSFCSELQTEGSKRPDVLLAADMPLQGVAAQFAGQLNRAILFTLRRHHFRAGRFTVGYQVCDDSDPREGTPQYGPLRRQRPRVRACAAARRADRADHVCMHPGTARDRERSARRAARDRQLREHVRRPDAAVGGRRA